MESPKTQLALDLRFNNAVRQEILGFYEVAFSEYISIITEDRRYKKAYLNLGSLLSRMNKLDEALRCYQLALNIEEDYITNFNIGCIYYKGASYKKAIQSLEKSKSLNPSFPLSMLIMGLCYSILNNYKAAYENFMDVIRFLPNNTVALTALAILQYNNDNYMDAMRYLDRIIAVDIHNVKAHELKFNILYKTGNNDQSILEIKELKQISNGYKFYDEFIQSISIDTLKDKYGTIDEKIDMLLEKIEVDRINLVSLSLCYLFKGETDNAIESLFALREK